MNARPTLRRRDEFQRAFRKGARAWQDFLQVRVWQREDTGPAHVGIVIRGTTIRLAVRRNRLRRLLRESFRRLAPQLPPGADVVLIPLGEPAFDHQRYVDAIVQRALKKAGLYTGDLDELPVGLPRNLQVRTPSDS